MTFDYKAGLLGLVLFGFPPAIVSLPLSEIKSPKIKVFVVVVYMAWVFIQCSMQEVW